uniref:Major facilitator superfamily (MFS) profile domain-containing protein n=1 Tax=Panagrolaimus sp. JU765 TaxID=591449 RepID=A0AC34QCE6_9BILA
MITISILIAQIMGLAMKAPEWWPIIFAIPLVPSFFQVVAMFFVIESPKYTVKKDKQQALTDLASLREASEDHPLVQQELQLILKESQAYENEPKIGILSLFSGKLLWPTFLACFLQAAQQLSGINAAMFYSTKIFQDAHLSEENSIYATLGMGSANVATTVVSFFLVEALGRRTLLLTGKSGMLISTIMLVVAIHQQWSWVSIALVVMFVVSFAIGPGSIPFFYVSEVFGSNARASASALATATNWTCNFIIGLGFPPIQKLIGEYVFLIFSGCLIVAIIVIIMWLPETKGKSIEEVQENMEKRKTKCCC